MSWTTPAELRAQVQKLWDKGLLLQTPFPLRLRLAVPSSSELAERFAEVGAWVAQLRRVPQLRIVDRELRHRVVGTQTVPAEVWLDTLDAALALVGKHPEAQRFAALVVSTSDPALQAWLHKRPLVALALADAWPRLLAVVAWVQTHPRPGIYLRQVDVPGVDSKFIELHRSVLAELLDLVLPAGAMDPRFSGVNQFARRYGFCDKPLRIRLRLLDGHSGFGSDISITQMAFEQLDLPICRVFMTENETNFLAFPPLPGSIVVFGAGYGFEALAGAQWLQQRSVYYWGDIDTHGFAILDQLRAHLPHTQSLLMDRATLLAHADHWTDEPQPTQRDLPRLTPPELALFDDLRHNTVGPRLRLEQERIAFGWVQQALAALPAGSPA